MNIPTEIIVIIFSYLTLEELCICEKVSQYWYQILLSSNSSCLYNPLDFSRQNIETSLIWLTKKLLAHEPRCINFSGACTKRELLTSILLQIQNFVESLDISFQPLSHEDYFCLSFPRLSKLVVNDARLKDSSLQIILSLPNLKDLNINYNSSLYGKPFTLSPKSLKSLWFEGCEHIEYSYIWNYLKNHGENLQELGLDGEYFSSSEVCSLLQLAPNLNKFAIEYANEMEDEIGSHLMKPTWKHFKIRRALLIRSSVFFQIFSNKLDGLLYLNLAECNYINDNICVMISNNCQNIQSFILTWCTDVNDLGIGSVVTKCKFLKYLELTGIKNITDLSFPLEDLGIYKHIETIILEKCNNITDGHLWRLSERYPKIKIKNYYGEFKEGWTGDINLYSQSINL